MANKLTDMNEQISLFRAIARNKLCKSIFKTALLPNKLINLLIDGLLLLEFTRNTNLSTLDEPIEIFNNNSSFYSIEASTQDVFDDYGFIISPFFKAYEGFLFYLADKFNIPVDNYKNKIGGLYNLDDTNKEKEKIIELIKDKFGSGKVDLLAWSNLGRVYQTFRNNPAHYGGDEIISFDQAENYSRTILTTINQTLEYITNKKYENL